MNQNKVLALVLAAGRGTRMGSNIPKPLNLVFGKPIISWIISSFKKNNIDIALIINPKDKFFFSKFDKDVHFIFQDNPNGTGHAVKQAVDIISKYNHTFIFVGDSPFVNHKLIIQMYNSHMNNNSDCTIISSLFINRKFPYARVVRKKKNIVKVVEEKDANELEYKLNELFGSHYLFKSKILLEFLDYLKPHKDNDEIYLTDILNELLEKRKKINSIIIDDWVRLVGLNTKEDIAWVESKNIV